MGKRRKSKRFVSRGGDKLDGALDALGVDVTGCTAADLGANVGGFTHCLLQRGIKKVYAVDTGYGVLEWKLRQETNVVVMERTNALHINLPEPVDLAVVDVGWTPLKMILPKAISLLRDGGFVIALLKPQYEAAPEKLINGVVPLEQVEDVVSCVIKELEAAQIRVVKQVVSALPGSGGNQEVFILVNRDDAS